MYLWALEFNTLEPHVLHIFKLHLISCSSFLQEFSLFFFIIPYSIVCHHDWLFILPTVLKGYNVVQWTSTLDFWETFGKIVSYTCLIVKCIQVTTWVTSTRTKWDNEITNKGNSLQLMFENTSIKVQLLQSQLNNDTLSFRQYESNYFLRKRVLLLTGDRHPHMTSDEWLQRGFLYPKGSMNVGTFWLLEITCKVMKTTGCSVIKKRMIWNVINNVCRNITVELP